VSSLMKKQSASGRFMQLVFDFLAPLHAEKPSREGAPLKKTEESLEPTSTDKGWIQTQTNANGLRHPKATHVLELGGLQVAYRMVRVKRKTIGMVVSQDGLEVRAARWVSIAQIQGALKEREDWILKQVQHMAEKAEQVKREAVKIESGCVSQVLGKGVQWIFSEGEAFLQSGHAPVALKEKTLRALQRENAKLLKSVPEHIQMWRRVQGEWHLCSWNEWCAGLQAVAVSPDPKMPALSLPDQEGDFRVVLPIASLLNKWMQEAMALDALAEQSDPALIQKTIAKAWMDAVRLELAREVLTQRVCHFEKMIGVRHTALTLGHAKQRWGSAGSNGAIRLNWHLVQVPMNLLDYVVAHELCHLKQMNHGPKFWAEMEKVMPDYAIRRRALKEISLTQWA